MFGIRVAISVAKELSVSEEPKYLHSLKPASYDRSNAMRAVGAKSRKSI